ncbi:hypothetical protein EBR96_07185, partial [bacterium]|nr:hypothetical protein [bacterium]
AASFINQMNMPILSDPQEVALSDLSDDDMDDMADEMTLSDGTTITDDMGNTYMLADSEWIPVEGGNAYATSVPLQTF